MNISSVTWKVSEGSYSIASAPVSVRGADWRGSWREAEQEHSDWWGLPNKLSFTVSTQGSQKGGGRLAPWPESAIWCPQLHRGRGGTHKMSKVFLSFSLKELFVKKKKKIQLAASLWQQQRHNRGGSPVRIPSWCDGHGWLKSTFQTIWKVLCLSVESDGLSMIHDKSLVLLFINTTRRLSSN